MTTLREEDVRRTNICMSVAESFQPRSHARWFQHPSSSDFIGTSLRHLQDLPCFLIPSQKDTQSVLEYRTTKLFEEDSVRDTGGRHLRTVVSRHGRRCWSRPATGSVGKSFRSEAGFSPLKAMSVFFRHDLFVSELSMVVSGC
jgi:hypothetical protein